MNPKTTQTSLSMGNAALRKKDYIAAIHHYQQALQERPELTKLINHNLQFTKNRKTRPNSNSCSPQGIPSPYRKQRFANHKFFLWMDENHPNITTLQATAEGEITLKNFGAAFLGPVFASFYSSLRKEIQKNSKLQQIFFLSREGYFLELAFKRLLQSPEERKIKTSYLICSRTLLFKLILAYPDQWESTLGHPYRGRMADFFKNRYAFTDAEISAIKAQSRTYQEVESMEFVLETNKHLILAILQEAKEVILSIVKPKLQAYSSYLQTMDFGSTDETHIVDIGFSGTIQKLLYQINKTRLVGHYFVTTNKAQNQNKLIFNGHIAANVESDTEPLLVRSLYMESLLTAPHGQTIDIGQEDDQIFFSFGKQTTAQHHFHELRLIIEGAIQYASSAMKNGAVMSRAQLSNYYGAFVKHKGNFPLITQKLFDIDDSISGFGTINPIKIF